MIYNMYNIIDYIIYYPDLHVFSLTTSVQKKERIFHMKCSVLSFISQCKNAGQCMNSPS